MKIAILGTVGVPGRYGGFETLAERLVHYHKQCGRSDHLTVWCSSKGQDEQPEHYESAHLRYLGLKANGLQSIPYDVISLFDAVRTGHDRIVLLGVSGALALPLVRLFSNSRIVTNIDGIEWKREKWSRLVRVFLRASEWAAVRFSHEVIADNEAIAEHVKSAYGSDCHVIAYGGDHALAHSGRPSQRSDLPTRYAIALCRIEPENNVRTILEAYSETGDPLVFVGNWENSPYGRELRKLYGHIPHLHLFDPIYEPSALHDLRSKASVYVHGHSAGGTNPSLVEMMHFGVPVFAHGCIFNRYSTEGRARYFESAAELTSLVSGLSAQDALQIGGDMREIAARRYTWDRIGEAYFGLLENA